MTYRLGNGVKPRAPKKRVRHPQTYRRYFSQRCQTVPGVVTVPMAEIQSLIHIERRAVYTSVTAVTSLLWPHVRRLLLKGYAA
jgi:hypothetical protein